MKARRRPCKSLLGLRFLPRGGAPSGLSRGPRAPAVFAGHILAQRLCSIAGEVTFEAHLLGQGGSARTSGGHLFCLLTPMSQGR